MGSREPAIAAAAIAVVSAAVQRSRAAVMLFVALTMAAGGLMIGFEYTDAERGSHGPADLEGAPLAELERHPVRCARPRWRCELAEPSDDRLLVPFECGGPEHVSAAFSEHRPTCAELPDAITGYLVHLDDASGGAPQWILQVGRASMSFPGFLTAVGAAMLLLGLAFPRLLAWSKRRNARPRA
jgi:hypothetical protein